MKRPHNVTRINKTHKLLFLVFLVVSSILITANNNLYAQRFNGGITAGLNAAQIDGDAHSGFNKAGLTAGGFVNTSFTDFLTGQFELKYIGKGAAQQSQQGVAIEYRTRLNYVAAPVLVQLRIHEVFWVEGGVETAFLMGSKEELDGNGFQEPNPSFNFIDLSYNAGLIYKFTESLSINARISYSVIPIREYPESRKHILDGGQNNKCASFSLYYQFKTR